MSKPVRSLLAAVVVAVFIATFATSAFAAAIDSTPPRTTSDASASYDSVATIHLTADDIGGSGVAHTYYVLDSFDEAAKVEGTVVTASTVGSHTLWFWSVDQAGNVENGPIVAFEITGAPPAPDEIAPMTTSDAKTSYVGTAIINLSASDNQGGSGVAHTYYKIDNGLQMEGLTVSTSIVGPHTASFWSVDLAGNVESAHLVPFSVTAQPPAPDTTAPTTTSDAKSSYVGSALITLSAVDNQGGSGVAHTYYSLDGAAQAEGAAVSVGTVGSHTLSFWSVDGAHNVETANQRTFDITAPDPGDLTAPVTLSDAVASYVTNAVVHLSASDAGSGVAHTYYILDGHAQAQGTIVSVPAFGSHTLSFWSVDGVGNIEAASQVTFSVTDETAPTTASDARVSYTGPATVRLTASDGGSGVAHTYYRLDGGAQVEGTSVSVNVAGAHSLAFWSVDVAGNVETQGSASFTVAKLKTSVTILTSKTAVRVRQKFILSGVLTPGIKGESLLLEIRKPGSKTLGKLTSPRGSLLVAHGGVKWTYTYAAPKKGTYYFRVSFLATSIKLASVSKIIKVVVR